MACGSPTSQVHALNKGELHVNPLDYLRRWWQTWTGEEETPFDGDTPAWIASLLVHLVLLVVLGLWVMYRPSDPPTLTLATTTTEDQQPVPEEVLFSDRRLPTVGANSLAGSNVAMASAPVLDVASELAPRETITPNLVTIDELLLADVSKAPLASQEVLVRGAAGEGATGASGAVDRITYEILQSLETRKTLVVWLFDQSGSMQPQREEITERFTRIYEELGLIESARGRAFAKHGNQPLLTAVMAFGENVSFRTPEPTADLAALQAAILGIENDPTGKEMVFTAVEQALIKYRKVQQGPPRRNMMVIIVSDEAGDDQQRLDHVLALCKRQAVPVYCIGVPAPFGRENVEIKYVDPDPQYDQSEQWIPVRQGPESIVPEAVQLGFIDGSRDDEYQYLDSGFGPFALTRLCVETGGIYFAVHPNRATISRMVAQHEVGLMSARLHHFFDPAVMRNYQPNYLPAEEYNAYVHANKARLALVQAARSSMLEPMQNPRLVFPKVDEGEFKASLDQAQQVAARLEPRVKALYDILRQGEADRPKLDTPRWQAGYDLAMGRVLAMMVRTRSYNVMLAKAKQGLNFQDPQSDTWVLEPADGESITSELDKLAKQARTYLERVVREHPRTPWALLAERELQSPLGWKWTERFTDVQRRRMMEGNAAPMPADQLNRMQRRPRREGIKL